MVAHFAYQNEGADSLKVPVGSKNRFSPGKEDLGQPTEFFKGRVNNVVTATIPAGATLRWILGDAFVDASIATVQCQPAPLNCTDSDIKDTLAQIDSISANMKKIVSRISGRVLATKASSAVKKKAQSYIDRAQALYAEQWNDVWGNFPQVIRMCPACRQIDKSVDIEELSARQKALYRLVKLSAQLLDAADPRGQKQSPDGLVAWATKLNSQFGVATQELPRFQSSCN
jgi:hypothetical protein